MKLTKFMKSLLSMLVGLMLAGCSGANAPELPSELVTSMNAYADQMEKQSPDDTEAGIVRVCVSEPTGLYWNHDANAYSVTCLLPVDAGSPIYGVVLMDGTTSAVLRVQHINAESQNALEYLIAQAATGWERK